MAKYVLLEDVERAVKSIQENHLNDVGSVIEQLGFLTKGIRQYDCVKTDVLKEKADDIFRNNDEDLVDPKSLYAFIKARCAEEMRRLVLEIVEIEAGGGRTE